MDPDKIMDSLSKEINCALKAMAKTKYELLHEKVLQQKRLLWQCREQSVYFIQKKRSLKYQRNSPFKGHGQVI